MRAGELLKLTPADVSDQKLILQTPKSGNEPEIVFIPKRIADRLNAYIREKGIKTGQRIFPVTYAGARLVASKAGKLAGINLGPRDLRKHAATYASGGVPIEIASKVILRHANLSTTRGILEKSAMPRRHGGLRTCTDNLIRRRETNILVSIVFV
jgi:integrase